MSKESLLLNQDLHQKKDTQKEVNSAIFLAIIVFLGIALRLYNLGTESYWIDEMSTVIEGQQSIQQLLGSGRLDQPLGYYLPFHFWVQFFGASEATTRLFSALAGISSIFIIYLIGRELFGNSVGLLSAFLMAISEFQIYYSQQARFYNYFELATLLSFLFFILALKSKRKIHFMLYAAASALMVYSHTYGMFILVAQAIFFVLQWKKHWDMIPSWFVSQVLILFAVIPYFYPLIFGGGGIGGAVGTNLGGVPSPGLFDPLRSIYRFIMSARGERSWEVMLVNYAVAGIFLVVGTWIYTIRHKNATLVADLKEWWSNLQERPVLTNKLLLVSCWLLFPIMVPFVLSMVISPMYLDRYTIGAAPALYLLLALGIFGIRKVVPIIISIGVLVVMIAPSLNHYYVTDVHEQWREAALYVAENSEPGEVIVFAANMGIGIQQETFNWYYQGNLPNCSLNSNLIDQAEITETLEQCTSGFSRFWVVIPNYEDSQPVELYQSFFLRPDHSIMRLVKERQFFKVSVYLFEYTK